MKSKTETIKDAYGEKYDICKPDENGWSYFEEVNRTSGSGFGVRYSGIFDLDDIEKINNHLFPNDYKWRPISLKGLDDNNGWFSVAEHGLPIKQDTYRTLNVNGALCYSPFNPKGHNDKEIWGMEFTHWKPIDNRKPIHL